MTREDETNVRVEDLLTSQHVADLIGVKVETIYHYKAQGKMPAPIIEGRQPMWEDQVIQSWIERRRKHAGQTQPD